MPFRSSPTRILFLGLLLLITIVPATVVAQGPSKNDPDGTIDILRLKTASYLAEEPMPRLESATVEGVPLTPEGVDPYTLVAWQSVRDGNWEIMAAVDREDNIIRLTGNNKSDVNPAIRPGSYDVAYVNIDGDSDIWRVGAYGPVASALTSDPANDNYPTYSPDGATLFFASTRSGNWDLYRMSPTGDNVTAITNDAAADIMPDVSSDGQSLIWVRAVSNTQGVIMRSDINGGNSQTLTAPVTFLQHPKFSPEGGRIGFDGDLNGDNWNDAAYLDLATNTVTIIEYGVSRRDVYFSAWSPANPIEVLYTQINYITYQGQLYINNAFVMGKQLTSYPRPLFNDSLAAMASWERSDNQAPSITTETLPEYSKVAGFGIRVQHTDNGPAPFNKYELQYRFPESGGAWTFAYQSPYNILHFNGTPGTLTEFRILGFDTAGNVSDFAPTLQTRFYSGDLHLTIHDSRGIPRPFTASLNPSPMITVTSGVNGATYRLSTNDTTTLDVTAPSFGQLSTTTLRTRESTAYHTYIPGRNNVVTNGGFEDNLQGWQTGGTEPPTAVGAGHTQDDAALFGTDFESWRLETLASAQNATWDSAMDSIGRIHRVYVAEDNHLYYQRRYTTGTWESAAVIGPASMEMAQIEVGSDGRVHILYGYQAQLYYRQRNTDGTWSAPTLLLPLQYEAGLLYDFAVDGAGRMHLLHRIRCDIATTPCGTANDYGLFHREFLPDGSALPDILIAKQYMNSPFGVTIAIASTSNGILHVWGSTYGHWIRQPGSEWTNVAYSPMGLYEQYGTTQVENWMIDADGTLHAIFHLRVAFPDEQFIWLYGQYNPSSSRWHFERFAPFPQAYDNQYGHGQFYLIPDGASLIVVAYGKYINVSRRTSDGVWSQTMSLRPYFYTAGLPDIYYRASEGFLFLGDTIFSKLIRPTDAQYSTLSTTVSLTNLTAPTLGFMYRAEQGKTADEGLFQVAVTNAITTTTIYKTNPDIGDWQYGWADLSPWANETVTVTFTYHHPAETPFKLFRLDDVTISEYLAPILTNATPASLPTVWSGETITITGANFTAPVSATVNGITAATTAVDDNTIQLVIPTNTRPGRARIAVTNAANLTTEATLVQFGLPVFLPKVSK